MKRLDEFLGMASGSMNRRQAGLAAAMLLALVAGADSAGGQKRNRNAMRERPQPSQGPGRRRRCGGIAGIPCPAGFTCVDDPSDDCDPEAGGADCIGICVRKVKDPCAAIRCRQGTRCCPKCGGICIPDDIRCSNDLCKREPCNEATCGPGEYCCNKSCSLCVPLGDVCTQQICPPKGETNPCAAILCLEGTTCCPQCGGICIPPDVPCSKDLCVSEPCNQEVCGPGEFCCNESCGICAPLGGGCTDQFCGPPD